MATKDIALRAEINLVFHNSGFFLDPKLLDECVSICNMYALEADSLKFKVEAINYKATQTLSGFSPVTMDTLNAVKTQIHQALTKDRNKAQPKARGTTAQVNRNNLPAKLAWRSTVYPNGTASVKQEFAPGATWQSSNSSLQNDRANVTFTGPPVDPDSRKKRAYHYMFEKISERSESLDQLIDDIAELIRGHYEVAEFGDPSASSDAEVVIVGRITHDADVGSMSKLLEGSMSIESSRSLSAGARIPLMLDPAIKIRGAVRGVGGFGIYPGAIVALKGKNGGGGYFLATEVLSIPPLKASPAALGIINPKVDPAASPNSASMLVVSGPFTSESDTGYKPWRTLLQQIKLQKPDVLLLIGPFVDATHPKIKAGDLDVSPSNLFKAHFVDPLKSFLTASPGSIVLLLPSVRDLTSNHAAFPQPEFDADIFNFNPRIHLLPNPARFSINDISFAATSVDTLFHLRKEEYFKRGVEVDSLPAAPDDLPADTMASLCRHMLLQRSFYPIFPPPPDLAAEVNLDMSHFDAAGMVDVDGGDLDYAPDVLILPSRLKQFSKVIHSTTTINPSFLSKGTYGTISLAPRSVGVPKDRLKAEVAKLEVPTVATPNATTT